jgi:hypothetical protein
LKSVANFGIASAMASPPYEIREFSEAALFAALSNDRCDPAEVARHQVARYLLGYLGPKGLNAQTIIVEHDYTDRDYLDDFAAYYVRCFQPYQRRCKRLHFFTHTIEPDKFLASVCSRTSAADLEEFQKNYLGFVVARPLPKAIIGRTVLATYGSDNGRRNYPCTLKYPVNLFGLELEISSLAFQEQDTVLAACATVSLWCCFNKTRHLFGSAAPTPVEITRTANQVVHLARPIPSHGLIVQQICHAIREAGLEPEVVRVKPETPLPSLLYAYLSVGLPVILAVHIEGQGGHAITLTGFSLKQAVNIPHELGAGQLCIPMPGRRINNFFAHDDQIGPFSAITARPAASGASSIFFDGSWVNAKTGAFEKLSPMAVIIPVYHKIRVRFIDVQKWVTRLHKVMLLKLVSPPPLEWDIRLTTIHEYKREVKETYAARSTHLHEQLFKPHPKYLWRAELFVHQECILELLSDATDMERSLPVYEVIWHNDELRDAMREFLNEPVYRQKLEETLTRPFLTLLLQSLSL